jgi:hypothetical protein
MPLIAPLINGHRYSYASIELALQIGTGPVQIITDVDDISYSESLELAFKQGTSRTPLGWTSGNYTPGDCALQLGKSTFTQLVLNIGPGWLGINLNCNIAYADIGEIVTVDTLVARIVGVEDGHSYGPDPLHSSLKLKPFTILRNGIAPMLNRVF